MKELDRVFKVRERERKKGERERVVKKQEIRHRRDAMELFLKS